jgi:O-antigen/teichoic acid export membrane protein
LKKLLTFGVPYQINTLLAVLKDDGMTIILGSILGTAGVGILGTAQRLAQYPLRFFMDNVTKVTFPAFSRMQDQRSDLAKGVTRSIFFICFLVFPSIIGLVVLAPLLVVVIPRYEKWAPALIPLSFLAINSLFAAVTTQITNLFNAIGKIKVTFKLMIMWTLLTFLLIPFLSTRFGVVGAASGYALVGTSSVIAIYIGRRMILFSLWDGVFKPGLAAGAMGLVLLFIRFVLPVNFYSVIFLVGLGIVVYALAIYFFVGSSILKDVKKGLGAIFSK